MTDKFHPLPLLYFFKSILSQLENGHFFGIQKELFYTPTDTSLETERFGRIIETPIGVAAGPHTQLAQNIIGAWLCGARYIELKTIQTLDELEVSKPCIDMQEEGYNCEWSQELKMQESFSQYLDAWLIIHLLDNYLGMNGAAQKTVFNMSAGYNMEGILQPNVQWFFQKMKNCSEELEFRKKLLSAEFPWVKDIEVPTTISDNITLSTMHGCPPDEIENIGLYLISEKKLHTIIKLNPTLLGSEQTREILNNRLGYKTPVPDSAFEHDLKYPDAIGIIERLRNAAKKHNVFFGLKLTNTLESDNFKTVFDSGQKQMYMSGKALHPLAINLALKIREDFPDIDISFSAGADCFNIFDILSCKLSPVTVSSDLLKPGGYARLKQYTDNIKLALQHNNLSNVSELLTISKPETLRQYAASVFENPRLKRSFRTPSIKTPRALEYFDCIHAPCVNTCPGNQEIPTYIHHIASGNLQKAFETILATNPFPSVTGAVCDHECQLRCTRVHYDEALAIRELKRYVSDFQHDENFIQSLPQHGQKAVIIGAGPAGLSCAWYLRLTGWNVQVYEEKSKAGGMPQQVIPGFRLKEASVEQDVERIQKLGVEIHYNTSVGAAMFESLRNSGAYIFAGTGASHIRKLNIPGEDCTGVEHPLRFLNDLKHNMKDISEARKIIIIGGGNTAMDVARSAKKYASSEAEVTVLYRRTLDDMPADVEEIQEAMHEGIRISELTAPVEILSVNQKITGITCVQMKSTGTDKEGRTSVSPITNSEFIVQADMCIPALGQEIIWNFGEANLMKTEGGSYKTGYPNVFIGGDARKGASNIISAIADGRKAAEEIIRTAHQVSTQSHSEIRNKQSVRELLVKKALRQYSPLQSHLPEGARIISNSEEALAEAQRCLLCDEICNICVSVCPNFANQSYQIEPGEFRVYSAQTQADGSISVQEENTCTISQQYQVYNIADFCNECGNCRTFCPTKDAPYTHKPKIHLTEESWAVASEGFRFITSGAFQGIEYKTQQNQIHRLLKTQDSFTYSFCDTAVQAKFNEETLIPCDVHFSEPKIKSFRFDMLPAMYLLLKYCYHEQIH